MRRLPIALLVVSGLVLGSAGAAGAQSIVNTSSTGGQTNWLESFASGGESGNSANVATISVLVQHPVNRTVTALRIDDNYDGTDNTGSIANRAVTPERPNLNGGYDYSRVTTTVTLPTANSGISCGFLSGTRKTTKPLRVAAVLDNGTVGGSTTSNITLTSTGQCTGPEDFAYIYQRSQTATSINPGQSVTFTYTGDDPDSLIGNNVFNGVRWRLRRLSDGATTATQTSCPENGDNAAKTLSVTFPNRGRWVVEAETLDGGGCGTADNPGTWWRLGSVDVNSPASASPDISLNATRPLKDGNTTVTATVADTDDAGQGGVAQDLEWDLDENTSNGVNGFEATSLGNWLTGLTALQKERTINTSGMSPGLHTVRARVGDNGALGGADNIRRTKIASTTFLVDHDPVVNNQSVVTETETPLAIDLAGTDVDGDTLSYSVTDAPDHGTLSGGTGANRTYTPAVGFAGTDSFAVSVADGFGGIDTATVSIRIDPDTTIDFAPSGTLDDRSASFDFSSHATGATFECSLDGATFSTCSSPQAYADLDDGSHEFRVRALAAGNTDQSPASRTWTIDAFPDIVIDSGPDPETANTSATFDFTPSEVGANVTPRTDCKLDGGDFRPCTSTISYDDLDDGPHTFVVRATDAYGKTATAEHDWTVDAIGSNTLIDSAPAAHTASTDATIAFHSPDPDATFQCQFDGGAWDTCASAVDLHGLAEGTHKFRVRAIDAADIVDPTPAQAIWRVDLTPPDTSFTSGPDGLTNDSTPTFEFSAAEAGTTYECNLDSTTWETCTAPYTTAALGDGDHRLEVRGTDAVGNVETSVAGRDFHVDTAPPQSQITGGPAEGDRVASSTVTLTFGSSTDPSADFRCRIDGGPWTSCSGAGSQTYSGLSDGDHDFSVRATDAAGNVEPTPPQRSWIVDVTPPQTSIVSGPAGIVRRPTASFELRGDDAEATFECSLDGGAFAACGTPKDYSGLADGAHTFAVQAVDGLGNVDATPATRTWTIDTSQELPPKGQEPHKKRKCTFERDVPRCGDPYIRAHAIAANGQGGREGFGKVKLKANGGGSPLSAASFKLPFGLRMRSMERGGSIGRLELYGDFKGARTMPIEAGGSGLGGRAGTPSVSVSTGGHSVKVKNIPVKVKRLRIVFDSPTLRIESTSCATKSWKAKLVDFKRNVAHVSTAADVRCPKGVGR